MVNAAVTLITQIVPGEVIVSTGGVSVGDTDYMTGLVQAMGRLDFWRVAVKPGKPLAVGAIARLVMGPAMSIQAPPNLSADYGPLLLSGINDWGGVSPLTPDFVNPEAPWPDIKGLRALCADAGYQLRERLTIYPEYLTDDDFLDPGVRPRVRALADERGLARDVSPEPLVEVAA